MNVKEVTQLARDIRIQTLKSLTHLGFGHYGAACLLWKRWQFFMAR